MVANIKLKLSLCLCENVNKRHFIIKLVVFNLHFIFLSVICYSGITVFHIRQVNALMSFMLLCSKVVFISSVLLSSDLQQCFLLKACHLTQFIFFRPSL